LTALNRATPPTTLPRLACLPPALAPVQKPGKMRLPSAHKQEMRLPGFTHPSPPRKAHRSRMNEWLTAAEELFPGGRARDLDAPETDGTAIGIIVYPTKRSVSFSAIPASFKKTRRWPAAGPSIGGPAEYSATVYPPLFITPYTHPNPVFFIAVLIGVGATLLAGSFPTVLIAAGRCSLTRASQLLGPALPTQTPFRDDEVSPVVAATPPSPESCGAAECGPPGRPISMSCGASVEQLLPKQTDGWPKTLWPAGC